MNAQVLTAIISAGATLLVCLINNWYTRRASDAKNNENLSLITYKIDELSKRMDKHNQLIDRTYKLEQNVSVLGEQMKTANHRLDDLERNHANDYK